ncbi:MAG: glycosyltransferase [Planctomycetota bacterium]
MRLSVVIPTLNEASCLGETIAVLRARTAGPPADVIVADCGSLDAMLAVATECGLGIKTAPSLTSRARACNAGAAGGGSRSKRRRPDPPSAGLVGSCGWGVRTQA